MNIKSNKILFINAGSEMLPIQAVTYHVLHKVFGFNNKIQFITLNYKDFIVPNWISIKKTKSIFRRRLNLLRNNNKYAILYLFSLLVSLPLMLINTVNIVIMSIANKDDKVFFNAFLLNKIAGLRVSDCILGILLRTEGSKGYLVRDQLFWGILIGFLYWFCVDYVFLRILSLFYCGHKYFTLLDTIYFEEALRRLFLKFKYTEIRYDNFMGKIVAMPPLTGSEINKKITIRNQYVPSENDLIKAKEKIEALVYRKDTYDYMRGGDVDMTIKLDLEAIEKLFRKKTAVIFLHQVSDGQYCFGVDCFTDLHDWLVSTLSLLCKYDINVIIKMHPAYFNSNIDYAVDKEYIRVVEDLLGVSFEQNNQAYLMPTKISNTHIIHHSFSTVALCELFPDLLCITHHGTVAIEAAYLGANVLVSSASPYISGIDTFVGIYSTIDEYANYIFEWFNSARKVNIKEDISLLAYVSFYYFHIKYDDSVLEIGKAIGLDYSQETNSSYYTKLFTVLEDVDIEDKLYNDIELVIEKFVYQ